MTSCTVSPVFVGRSPELARLTEALAEADAGTPRIVLVAGEAGVGKTRLVEEFLGHVEGLPCGRATPARNSPGTSPAPSDGLSDSPSDSPFESPSDGPVAVVGQAVEMGAEDLPFVAVSSALRALYARIGPEIRAAVAGREQDLAWLLPDLGPRPAAADTSGLERARVFEVMLRLLERLTEKRTLILVLEDLHWADSSTRELLGFLARSLRTGRVLFIVTYRADAIDRRHPMRFLLAELDRLRAVARIGLDRLTVAEVAEQLRGILGTEPPRRLVRQVFRKSEGNAFFVEELACGIQDGRLTGLTDSLRDLLLIRIEQLDATTREVVRLAAVGGDTVGHRLLGAVADLPPAALDDALRAAVSAHVLVPSDDGEGYRFRHALVREAVADDLLPGERTRTHLRYAEVLEGRPDLVRRSDLAVRRATHWYHSGHPDKALPAVLEAAEHARSRYAYGEHLRLLERALELWDLVDAPHRPSGRTKLDILEEAIPPARLDNRHERAFDLVLQALDAVDEAAEPRRAALLWNHRSRLMRTMARSQGEPELRRASALLVGLPPSEEHAEVLGQLAGGRMLDGDAEGAVAAARAGLDIARRVGDTRLEIQNGRVLGCALVFLGRVTEGLEHMRHAGDVAERAGDAESLSAVHGNHASLLEGLGRHREAVELARRAVSTSRTQGDLVRNVGAFSMGNLAEGLFSLGAWDELAEVADEALEQDPVLCVAAPLELLLSTLALARGDTDGCAVHLEETRRAIDKPYTEPQLRIPLRAAEVAYARHIGEIDEVRRIVTGEIGTGFPPGHQRYAWPLLTEAMGAEGDLTEASPRDADTECGTRAGILGRIAGAAARLPVHCDLDRAHAATFAAEHARALGTATAADWRTAATAWERIEQPYTRARVLTRWAGFLVASGERDQAAEVLARAHAPAVRLGAAPLVEAIELLARRARIDAGLGGGPAGGDPGAAPAGPALTPREREVLELLAEGHSNRRIAGELFISVKTAGVHVSNILRKLEVSNRGEAAALAHRLNLLAGRGAG